MPESFDFDEVYLVIFRGNDYVLIHQIEDGETSIGRTKTSTVMLPDRLVSRSHAVVFKNGAEIVIRDLMSRNGTSLDGKFIKEAKLFNCCKIEIGPYDLKCFSDCSEALQATVVSDTSTLTANSIAPNRPEVQHLTLRQKQVYEGLLNGLSEKELARHLGISIHTVHGHVKGVYLAFSVCSRSELLTQSLSQRVPKK